MTTQKLVLASSRLACSAILGAVCCFAGQGIAAESGTFTGTWVANGTKEVMPFGEDREAALFKLSGHVNLKDGVGASSDFWSECIGLADSQTGSSVRCTWRNPEGHRVFLTLVSERLTQDSEISGTIVGGSGPFDGITGSFEFIWSSMNFHPGATSTVVGGYAKELNGVYQLP